MSSGRVHALAVATRPAGQVVYERFYDAFSEAEKGEIRSAFDAVAGPSGGKGVADDEELVGRYRNGRIVCIPSGELLFYALGTGEYNELALAEVLRAIIGTYRELFKAPALTEAALFSNYALTALVVDEVCREGLVELTDRLSIQKAIAMRLPYEPAAEKSKGTLAKLMSSKASPQAKAQS
ncbi:6-phosphogluconolactonase 1 [Chlorella sorokiniana]|jgi:hypothetical protein|uniref:Coatomer subunit zeta n=1 Tax=Chlorella sorokiniana TaxID=3076 RepID=A0A2P6U1G4_CHLSO|nr:6-phosphogluconolactonase 1 [Chlorella sorokiniana]|eukprot:PRW60145.1 6-phosphogluconolactonase 1 [Chlorella sorokiniana]